MHRCTSERTRRRRLPRPFKHGVQQLFPQERRSCTQEISADMTMIYTEQQRQCSVTSEDVPTSAQKPTCSGLQNQPITRLAILLPPASNMLVFDSMNSGLAGPLKTIMMSRNQVYLYADVSFNDGAIGNMLRQCDPMFEPRVDRRYKEISSPLRSHNNEGEARWRSEMEQPNTPKQNPSTSQDPCSAPHLSSPVLCLKHCQSLGAGTGGITGVTGGEAPASCDEARSAS